MFDNMCRSNMYRNIIILIIQFRLINHYVSLNADCNLRGCSLRNYSNKFGISLNLLVYDEHLTHITHSVCLCLSLIDAML